jgi:hypothetical protein
MEVIDFPTFCCQILSHVCVDWLLLVIVKVRVAIIVGPVKCC